MRLFNPPHTAQHGVDYFFISKAEFDEMIERDELNEWGERDGTSTLGEKFCLTLSLKHNLQMKH